MNHLRPLSEKSASAAPDSPAPCVSGQLSPLLALVDTWAAGALALIVGGSHATGADVWVTLEGHPCCLSDLDVYAVVPHRAAQRAAAARARADRAGLRARLLAWGFAAPLEAAFLTPDDLERLPARPGTLELARHGLVLKGDPAWKERIPRWDPREVSPEETLLLHENRAFELLMAWPTLAQRDRLPRLQGRHAVLKCALDVVRVEALSRGEYPEGAEALAAWAARAVRPALPAPAHARFRALLEAALDWRAGRARELEPGEGEEEWRAAVSAWVATWQGRVGSTYEDALDAAKRARLRRRLRQALCWPTRSGLGPPLSSRLFHALRGTPQHRVNAGAAVLLMAADRETWTEAGPRLPEQAARALVGLGVVGAAQRVDWAAAARGVVVAWDRWVLDGQRTQGPP